MNTNKKIMIAAVVLLITVFFTLSACKKTSGDGSEVVVVTDVNGVPVTDQNGEAMTVVLETEIVEVTNADGEKVYDEDGNVKTSVIYKQQEVGVPVTDANGVPVTNQNGEIETTMVVVPPTTGGAIITEIPLTDSNGTPVTKPDGETVTYTMEYTTSPATPGDNSSNWGATFGGTANDSYNDTAATPDGGFIAVVQANSRDGSLTDLYTGGSPTSVLLKYDKNGKLKWQKAIDGDRGITIMGLDVDKDGNIIAAGYTKSTNLGFTNAGDYDAVVYKFNSKGDEKWVKSFSGNMTDGFNDVCVAPDGNYVVAGFTFSYNRDAKQLGIKMGESRAMVAKYDTNGNLMFIQGYGNSGDTFKGVTCDTNGDIYAVGNFQSGAEFASFGRADGAVAKLSADGTKQWIQQFGGSKIESFSGITAAQDGGCVIVGKSDSTDYSMQKIGNYGGYDGVIVKYNPDGTIGWQTSLRGYFDENFSAIQKTADGYVLAGESGSSNRDLRGVGNRGGSDAIVVTVKTNGTIQSVQSYGGRNDDAFASVCVLKSGEYIACGSTLSPDGDLVGSKHVSDGQYTMGMIARFK